MLATTRRQQYINAVNSLKPYVNGVTVEDFVATILNSQEISQANTNDAIDPETVELAKFVSPIINIIGGGKFTHEILSELDATIKSAGKANSDKTEKSIARSVRFTLPDTTNADEYISSLLKNGIINGNRSYAPPPAGEPASFSLNQAVGGDGSDKSLGIGSFSVPKKTDTVISVIEMLNNKLGISVRDTSGLSIFSTILPAHIISRAVPFVAVRLHGIKKSEPHPDPELTGTGFDVVSGLSTLRYLKGRYLLREDNVFDSAILGYGQGKDSAISMDIFTAPQTMVADHDDVKSQAFNGVRPIDRFKPLLTLAGITFDIAPSGAGAISFKTGKMSLVLHDRGRLSEVAPFVKADLYSTAEIEIEYGWSIDTSSGRLATDLEASNSNSGVTEGQRVFGGRLQDDALSQFVDSLRVTEKYIVVNSSFNFDDSGQVNIELNLSLKGTSDIQAYDVTGDAAKTAKENLKVIIGQVNEILGLNIMKDVVSDTFRGAVASEDALLAISPEDLKKVTDEIAKIRDKNAQSEQITSLAGKINDLLTLKNEAQSSGDAAVDDMFSRLSDGFEPFAPCSGALKDRTDITRSMLLESGLPVGSKDFESGAVSLGRALLVFVGQPLSKLKRFDEIQFIFNKFNDRASYMRSLSIASFPLDTKKLQEAIKGLYKKQVRVSVKQVIDLLGSFVENVANAAYGFSSAYDDKGNLKANVGLSTTETSLRGAGILDTNFTMPKLSITTECIPHHLNRDQTILRFHITDAQASPYQEYHEAIVAGRSSTGTLIEAAAIEAKHPLFTDVHWNDLDPAHLGASRENIFKKMKDANVLVAAKGTDSGPQPTPGTYDIDLSKLLRPSSPDKMRQFMSKGMPVIRYGSAAGMVKSITVSSINDARLNTVNIIKAQESAGDPQAATRQSGLPLLVNGTELQMEMMGCPIINFMQCIYFDIGTGTSVDNIYTCTGISHKISPGEFSTSAKFILNVGAYGIYSSGKRQLTLLTKLAQAAAGGSVATPSLEGTPEKPFVLGGNLSFGNSSIDVALAEAIAGSIKTTIRLWFDSNGKPLNIAAHNEPPGPAISSDLTVQLVGAKDKTALQILNDLPGEGITCYEFPKISSGTQDIINNLTIYEKTSERTSTSRSKVLNVSALVAELKKVTPKKKKKAPPAKFSGVMLR